MIAYLAGPIAGCTDAEARDWREEAKRRLLGFECLDPMRRDFREGVAGHEAEIVEGDKGDIDRADLVLAYCPRPSVGTSMEILFAHQLGKPVIAVVPPGVPVSPWITYHATAVVPNLMAAAGHAYAHAVRARALYRHAEQS